MYPHIHLSVLPATHDVHFHLNSFFAFICRMILISPRLRRCPVVTGEKDTLERKKKRRIVKELDDDVELEVLTSPENKPRSRPNPGSSTSTRGSDARPAVKKLLKSGSGAVSGGGRYGVEDRDLYGASESRKIESANARPARARDARVVESDGTSSGEEDNAWFKKPSKTAGSGAGQNNGGASRKASDVLAVKVKRAKALADPGQCRHFVVHPRYGLEHARFFRWCAPRMGEMNCNPLSLPFDSILLCDPASWRCTVPRLDLQE